MTTATTSGRATTNGRATNGRTGSRSAAPARVPQPRTPVAPRSRAAGAGPAPARPAPRAAPAPTSRAAPAPTSRAALGLLRQAADGLAEAHRVDDPLLRYPAAYLAALRAGAAVLAVRARPRPRRGSTRNVWQLLAEVAPEFAEWALFFASCSDTRAAAEAGIARLVGRRDADDLLRQAEQFVGIVTASVPLR
ncbi:SAV_6107 family HEPN domain-containing protein [Pseudonocardia sichuanensis]